MMNKKKAQTKPEVGQREAQKKKSLQRRRLSKLLNTNFKDNDIKIQISYKKVEN